MKIALDPYMFRRVPLTDLPGLVADLGYSWIELSPRADFLPFFLHPRADKAQIAAFSKALDAAGVKVASVLPLYRWSGPDEDERRSGATWPSTAARPPDPHDQVPDWYRGTGSRPRRLT
jgi:myo-inositol catabolism protein IolH